MCLFICFPASEDDCFHIKLIANHLANCIRKHDKITVKITSVHILHGSEGANGFQTSNMTCKTIKFEYNMEKSD